MKSTLAETDHAAFVDAWIERAAADLPAERLLRLSEMALNALWRRAQVTLGDVTLGAIVDRVLYNTTEKFPMCSSFKLDPNGGVQFGALRADGESIEEVDWKAVMRFVLVEFLTVIGNLTAEILTPELHGALSKVALGDTDR